MGRSRYGYHVDVPPLIRPWLRIGLHLLVVLGLLGTLGTSIFAERYFNRGVAASADLTPIPHTDVNPLGVNTFLHEEVNPETVERTLDMIAAAGITYVRQPFFWFEIEPAPDTYWDAKFNKSSWLKYDRIVNLAHERGLELIVRLDKPPRWAREGMPNLDQFPDGPPRRIEDYAEFVAAVVNRYRGKIHYIQIWNEPNLAGEWGGQPIDPAAFTELLKAAYTAAKEVNPSIVVLLPGLAPTDQTGPHNLSDLLFLEGLYKAGAKDYFDIASAMVYGYGYSPYDRRVEFPRNNFSRVIQLREIMVRYGDGHKPIWATEYGWVSLPEDWTGMKSVWGEPVSEAEQAEYLLEGYLRAQREWPWMGPMAIWFFRWARPPDHPDQVGNPTRGFRIVHHDFSPRPAYTLLARSRSLLDRAYTGAYRADSRLIRYDDAWTLSRDGETRRLMPEEPGAVIEIPFSGTRLDLLLSGSGSGLAVTIDGQPAPKLPKNPTGATIAGPTDDGSGRVTVADGLDDGPHVARLTALDGAADSVALNGIVVARRPLSAWIYPWIRAGVALVLFLNLLSLWWAFRERRVAPMPPPAENPQPDTVSPVPEDTVDTESTTSSV